MTTAEILTVSAAWAAALGTIFAALIALWLANRSSRVRLRGYFGIRDIVGQGVKQQTVTIKLTNTGERPVIVSSVGWRLGRRQHQRDFMVPITGQLGDQVPKTINHGESATFFVAENSSPNWLHVISQGESHETVLRTLRGVVHTSIGHTEIIAPELGLLEKFRETAN